MPETYRSTIVMEKSPEYVHHLKTPERIYEMNSTIKLMVLICDPIRRAVSEYVQSMSNHVRDGKEVHPFEYYAVDPESGELNVDYFTIKRGRYSVYMKPWLGIFKQGQIHIADGDQFRENPLLELKKVESFLGIENYFDESMFTFNKTKGFYCSQIMKNNCLSADKGRPHPTVDSDVMDLLRTFYEPYNNQLFKMINKIYDW